MLDCSVGAKHVVDPVLAFHFCFKEFAMRSCSFFLLSVHTCQETVHPCHLSVRRANTRLLQRRLIAKPHIPLC
jgi:hypothetical protein